MSPRRRVALSLIAAVCAGAVALTVVVATGLDLPGPSLRERLGFDQSGFAACTPEPENVRSAPGAPADRPRWRSEPPLPSPRDEAKAIARGTDIWVLSGAVNSDDGLASLPDVLSFDPATGRYERQADIPQALDHVAAGAYRGDVLVAGGYTATRSSGRAWRYSGAERRWSAAPSLPAPRAAAGSAMLGPRLYIAGGIELSSFAPDILEAAPLASVQVYDFLTGRWSEATPLNVPRHHLALVAHEGALYALGGRTAGDFSSDAVERYDPSSDRWEQLPAMPQGVGGPGAASTGERIIVAGGGDDAERWITPATWSYDPRRQSWKRLADLGEPRHGLAMEVAGGRAYVFGGSPCPGFGLARTVESLDVSDP